MAIIMSQSPNESVLHLYAIFCSVVARVPIYAHPCLTVAAQTTPKPDVGLVCFPRPSGSCHRRIVGPSVAVQCGDCLRSVIRIDGRAARWACVGVAAPGATHSRFGRRSGALLTSSAACAHVGIRMPAEGLGRTCLASIGSTLIARHAGQDVAALHGLAGTHRAWSGAHTWCARCWIPSGGFMLLLAASRSGGGGDRAVVCRRSRTTRSRRPRFRSGE